MLNQKYEGERLTEPRAVPTEFYIRNKPGQTFWVSSLEEAIRHLLSDEGYRLSIYPPGSDTPSIVIRRIMDRELTVRVHGSGLSTVPPPNRIETEEEMVQRLRLKDPTTS